jgi:hypothetical protein
MRPLLAALLVAAGVVGCAGGPVPVSLARLPAEARADPEQYLIITVRNVLAPLQVNAGSTRRGYGGSAAYAVSATAESVAREIATDYGLQQVAAWPITVLRVHCLVFRVPDGEERSELLSRLAADPRVELAQPLQSFSTSSAEYNDRYATLQRGFDAMSIAAAHRWSRGEGVLVAVIDSGVDSKHPDLAGRVRAVRNFVAADGRVEDPGRHGTEVAGVIAAVGNNGEGIVGVAPGVELLVLRACWQAQETGAAARCNTFTLAQALVAAIAARADVINLSLVGPADPLLGALTAQATAMGSIVVGAVPPGGRLDGFPAGAPGVLPVAMAEDTTAASAALRAPGKEILTLTPGGTYDFATGSSLAAGNVSGIVALLRARRNLTAAQAKAVLAGATRPVEAPGGAVRSIDACLALASLLAGGDCPDNTGAGAVPGKHSTRGGTGGR